MDECKHRWIAKNEAATLWDCFDCGEVTTSRERWDARTAEIETLRQQVQILEARNMELESMIADLPCNDPCCGLCDHVCSNCRKRNKAFGDS